MTGRTSALAASSSKQLYPILRKVSIVSFLPDLGVVALLAALCALFYWRILTPDVANRASFPDGDFVEQFYAFAVFRARELAQGRLPLWSPHAYGGHPFVADIQSAVFYPPSWITTLLTLLGGYSFFALEVEAVVHVFLASVFTYLFARELFHQRLSALVAAIVFAYGGYLTSYPTQQLSILETEVWLPLLLLCIHRSTLQGQRLRGRLTWTLCAGIFMGISFLGGHPQAAMYVVYGSGAYWVYRSALLWWRRGDIPQEPLLSQGVQTSLASPPSEAKGRLAIPTYLDRRLHGVLPLTIAGLYLPIGLALAAVQLIPTIEYMQLSSRAKLTYDFTWWGFPLQDILQLLLPGSVSLASPMYIGILPLILALLAVLWPKERDIVFWAALAVVALLISFGGHTFLYSALYVAAPGFAMFRDHERTVYLFSFAMAILAGYGFSFWKCPNTQSDRPLLWALTGAAIMAFGLLILFYTAHTVTGKFSSQMNAAAFLLILLVLSLAIAFLRSRNVPGALIQVLTIAIIVFDLFTVNWKNNLQNIKPEERYPVTPIIRELLGRLKGEIHRVHNEYQLPLNYGAVYGVFDTMGASPLVIARYKELQSRLPRERFWQLMSVKYLVTWEGGYPGGQRIVHERGKASDGSTKDMYLYVINDTPPLAKVVGKAIIADGDDALAALAAPDFDPREEVVLPAPPPVPLPGRNPKGEAHTIEYAPGRIVIDAHLDDYGLLSLAEVYYPGWRATVDGRPTPVLRANHALRAVPLEPGTHRIELIYDPASFRLGATVSVLTLACMVAALVVLIVLQKGDSRRKHIMR